MSSVNDNDPSNRAPFISKEDNEAKSILLIGNENFQVSEEQNIKNAEEQQQEQQEIGYQESLDIEENLQGRKTRKNKDSRKYQSAYKFFVQVFVD